MKSIAFGLALALAAALPAAAADLPAGYGRRAAPIADAGTFWKTGPVASIWENRDYVQVVPVYQRGYVEKSTGRKCRVEHRRSNAYPHGHAAKACRRW